MFTEQDLADRLNDFEESDIWNEDGSRRPDMTIVYWRTETHDWPAFHKACDLFRAESPHASYHEGPRYEDFKHNEPVDHQEFLDDASYDSFLGALDASDRGVLIPNIGQAFRVTQFGGEGEGDQYYYIFKVLSYDTPDQLPSNGAEVVAERFFKVSGYYASYDGGYYDELFEVKPVEKPVTFWEAK